MPDNVEKELREQIKELQDENASLKAYLAKLSVVVILADFVFKLVAAKLGIDLGGK